MEQKALMALMADMLNYYKRQSKILIWVVVAILVMHLATVFAFLYYESLMETVTTTTTTTNTEQEVNGDDGNIVNGDYEENNYGGETENNDNDHDNDNAEEKEDK